jgi:4-diphosphocytidyl-2-C-methyl-D-erythritol kinase
MPTFSAPAKINLSLLVRGRREDGFHEIETRMVPVSLGDRLDIERGDGGGLVFTCDDPTVPGDDTNLVVGAARLFCSTAQVAPDLRIALHKAIPHGAGLGGGSSDAATTLLALNGLFSTGFPPERLAALAAELGSDIPFFIYQSAAICRGRGEQVVPEPFPHRLPLLLIKPPFGVPTPWAYKQWRDSREIPGVSYAPQVFLWGELHNDLERPVFEKYIFLAALKTWLLAQPETAGALMSGSGATVFALLREPAAGPALRTRLLEQYGPDLWCEQVETLDTGLRIPDTGK